MGFWDFLNPQQGAEATRFSLMGPGGLFLSNLFGGSQASASSTPNIPGFNGSGSVMPVASDPNEDARRQQGLAGSLQTALSGRDNVVGSSDPYAYLSQIQKGLSGAYVDPAVAAAQAEAAYAPAVAALQKEKGLAKKRTGQYKAEAKTDFAAQKKAYQDQAAAELKIMAENKAKDNKALTAGVQATSDEYNKLIAEKQAQAATLGMTAGGASAQATETLMAEAAAAQENIRSQAQAQADFRANEGKANADFMTGGALNVGQLGTEANQALTNALETKLSGLSKEQANIQTQAGSAANAARQSAGAQELQRLSSMMQLDNQRASRFFQLQDEGRKVAEARAAAGMGPDTSKMKGQNDAKNYLFSVADPAVANKFLQTIMSNPSLLNDQYAVDGESGQMAKLPALMQQQLINDAAQQVGINPSDAQLYWEIMNRGG